MPSDGQTPLTSRQTVWQLPLGWLSESTATTITFALLLLLLLTGAQGRSKSRNAGTWISADRAVEPLGMWISQKATVYDRYDNWVNLNSLMRNWEIAVKLSHVSYEKAIVEFTEPVNNLLVQVTPCSGPIQLQLHADKVAVHSKTAPKEAFTNRPNADRNMQPSGQDLYPALDSRLSGELSSAARLMWITLSSTSLEKAATSVYFAPLPPRNETVNDYATIRLYTTQNFNNDYPPLPQHITAPRVEYIENTNRVIVHVDLIHLDYDSSNTRQLTFCMVVNNVRPLPQWCSAQIAIPQMPQNRKIWAKENAFHLPQGQFNFTCRRAVFGRSPSDMEVELPEALLQQVQQTMEIDSPHLSPIYLNVYTINEDKWHLASAGSTLVLKLPVRTRKSVTADKTLGLTDFNMERRLQSVVSPSNRQCSCILQVPVVLGQYFKRDVNIFVMPKKLQIREPLEARVWPLITASDSRWTCREKSTKRMTFLPSSGQWLCRSSQPFTCPPNQAECHIETHMLELRSLCLSSKGVNASVESRRRCPVVKFHLGTPHGHNASVRHLDYNLVASKMPKCSRISWLPSNSTNSHKLQRNCMSEVLRKSLKHQRVKNNASCPHCLSIKLVVAPGLTKLSLQQLFPDPTNFTFRMAILNKKKQKRVQKKQACECRSPKSAKCRQCVLKSLNLYRPNTRPCRPPSCQQVQSLAKAMQGVTLSIKRRGNIPQKADRQKKSVLLQVYAASEKETCGRPIAIANLNTCLDVSTLVASRVVNAPLWLR